MCALPLSTDIVRLSRHVRKVLDADELHSRVTISSALVARHRTVGEEHKVKDGALRCVGRNPQMAIV